MGFGLFGGSDSSKKGDGGSDSSKKGDGGSDSSRKGDGGSDSSKKRHGGSESSKKGDGGSDSSKKGDEGSDSIKKGDGGSDSGRRGEEDTRSNRGDEGSGSNSRKHASTERSRSLKEEGTESPESSTHSSVTKEGSSDSVVSEARKIQVKEAELEQAKLTSKDVHRRQEQVYGNFWSVCPLRWATITGNMYALLKFKDLNSVRSQGEEFEGLEHENFLELLNQVDEVGMNCLHLAANRGQCSELTQLLHHRDMLCKSMTTLKDKIHHAAKLKSLQSLQRDVNFEEVLSFFVSIPGIDLNAVDKKGNTPLLLASMGGHLKAVEVLLRASAAIDILNEEGLNCLHTAALAGHTSVVDRIVQEAGEMDMVYLNVKSRADKEWTALHYAVANTRIHTLELLLNYPDIVVDAQDNEGCTPLILACSLGYVPAVTILLRNGANKFMTNNAMLNSLKIAAGSGHVEVLKELTEHSNKTPEVPAAAPVLEDPSDQDTQESEQDTVTSWPQSKILWFTKSSEVRSETLPSPSKTHEDEVQYLRPSQSPYEYKRSEQILRNSAEVNMGSEMSAVSLAVS